MKARPLLTISERATVEQAIQELQDMCCFGTRAHSDAGLEGIEAIEQVESTREAVADAMKVVTAFRRRAVRAGS